MQARDLLQHLWTGPISNAPVDIIQGAKSVEVRPVGLSKGASMAKVRLGQRPPLPSRMGRIACSCSPPPRPPML